MDGDGIKATQGYARERQGYGNPPHRMSDPGWIVSYMVGSWWLAVGGLLDGLVSGLVKADQLPVPVCQLFTHTQCRTQNAGTSLHAALGLGLCLGFRLGPGSVCTAQQNG